MIKEILTNQIIVPVAISWIFCQCWKMVDKTMRNSRFDFSYMLDDGGMPSSHSTFVCAIAVSIGFVEGFLSSIFLLASGLAIVVVRDAFGVRQAVDHLTKTVNHIIKEKKVGIQQILKLTGHTPVQAIVGALIGIVIPVLFRFFIYS